MTVDPVIIILTVTNLINVRSCRTFPISFHDYFGKKRETNKECLLQTTLGDESGTDLDLSLFYSNFWQFLMALL